MLKTPLLKAHAGRAHVGAWARRRAEMREGGIGGTTVFESVQVGSSTSNALSVGDNIFVGSLTGTLLPGVEYALFNRGDFSQVITGESATASGSVRLALLPAVPSLSG